MDRIASLYPAIEERKQVPALQEPLFILLTLIPFLFRRRRLVAAILLGPILGICLYAPTYTTGDRGKDYFSSSAYIGLSLWFIEIALLSPESGPKETIYVGPPPDVKDSKIKRQRWSDLTSIREKLYWGLSLMILTQRGIGWSWQAKKIPVNTYKDLPKWVFVRKHLMWMMVSYVRSAMMLVALGFAFRMQHLSGTEDFWTYHASMFLLGWAGATWIWDRLSCTYSIAAASSVAVGLCENWQWPPMMNHLRYAWSVRNMWGDVYHQTLRMMVSQPSLRITRLLGVRKGSLASRYVQLILSFGFSCLIHVYQMFHVTRRDEGEFMFFMTQPIAIMIEDFVQWVYARLRNEKTKGNSKFSTYAGYVWVFLWFSYCLPPWVKGFTATGVTRDALFDQAPFQLGSNWADIIHHQFN